MTRANMTWPLPQAPRHLRLRTLLNVAQRRGQIWPDHCNRHPHLQLKTLLNVAQRHGEVWPDHCNRHPPPTIENIVKCCTKTRASVTWPLPQAPATYNWEHCKMLLKDADKYDLTIAAVPRKKNWKIGSRSYHIINNAIFFLFYLCFDHATCFITEYLIIYKAYAQSLALCGR